MISVLVLTKNEENDLPGCLESVSWCDDVVVYDSLSTDGTVEVAQKYGARIVQREFDNWSSHQNWGLRNIAFRHPWVFYIDADERMDAALVDSARRAVQTPGEHTAFRVRRRDFLGGRWLKHVQATPFFIRLFLPSRMRYERLVNPISIVDGAVGELNGYLDHFPFSKGVTHWLARHNSYSTFEAQQILSNRRSSQNVSLLQALIAADPTVRRFHQKELFYRMPFRPLVKFLLLYIVKRGFLDGSAGWTYSTLQSMYEYMIVLKTRELEIERERST